MCLLLVANKAAFFILYERVNVMDRTLSVPPEGWRERVEVDDMMIGYVLRRMEQERDVVVPYSEVRHILRYVVDYKGEQEKRSGKREIPSKGIW